MVSVPSPAATKRRDLTFTAAFSLIAVLTACAVVLIALPRAVEPVHLPPLVLDAEMVRAALARDAELAEKVPQDKRVDELYELYLAEGRAELEGTKGALKTAARRTRLGQLSRAVFASIGADGVLALRARATERFMRALMGELPDAHEARGLVGDFPNILRRYGLLAADLTVFAPELCVRAMYKARWNMIHELSLHEHFEPSDILAYEGWNALHAGLLAPARRLEAARLFHAAGGRHGAEAYATWLYQSGAPEQARALLEEAYARTGQLRLRNKLLAVRRAAPH